MTSSYGRGCAKSLTKDRMMIQLEYVQSQKRGGEKEQWDTEKRNISGYLSSQHFCPIYNDAKIFENHLNPVMLVLIGKLSLSTFR